jgi:hypothetical protein
VSRLLLIAGVVLLSGPVCCLPAVAQTSNAADTPPKSWTSTSFLKDPAGTANPTRMTESHTESNGHIVDKRKLERLGPGGEYVPYLEIERETIRTNSSTTKTVERSYGTNADGGRKLVQETSEEQQKLNGGGEKFVRSVSNPDGNGVLRVVQQETRQSKATSTGVNESDSTLWLPDMNGRLSPSRMSHLREQKKSNDLTVYKQTESLPDGNGGWRVNEVREGKITGKEGEEQVKEENVSHADLDGRLNVDQHTVTKEEKAAAGGQKRKVVETYSAVSPGSTPDGMQLNERVITVNKTGVGGEKSTVQQVQGRNPGDPNAGMRTTSETIDIVRPGPGGTSRQEKTVKSAGSNGSLGAVWVDMGKAQDTTPVTIDTKKPSANSASASRSSTVTPSATSQTKTK